MPLEEATLGQNEAFNKTKPRNQQPSEQSINHQWKEIHLKLHFGDLTSSTSISALLKHYFPIKCNKNEISTAPSCSDQTILMEISNRSASKHALVQTQIFRMQSNTDLPHIEIHVVRVCSWISLNLNEKWMENSKRKCWLNFREHNMLVPLSAHSFVSTFFFSFKLYFIITRFSGCLSFESI